MLGSKVNEPAQTNSVSPVLLVPKKDDDRSFRAAYHKFKGKLYETRTVFLGKMRISTHSATPTYSPRRTQIENTGS